MTSSLPDKQFDGQTGFPTPNAPPDLNGCRVFRIPSDEEWFALFMDAALKLTYEWAWYKNGTMTQAEAAAAWSQIIDRAYDVSLTGECAEDVPTPYWDESSGDDADDTMDVLDQIWYGEIVTTSSLVLRSEDVELSFLDNLGIWLIAGFIAYAGQPAAAIAFVPVARRFVLYFKKSPTGAIVNILADFLHIADIDTYGVEDEIGTLLVTMPDDATTLYVVQADESNPAAGDSPNMNVIRSRLSEDNFSNPAYRYDAECDCIQFSPDGGTTWNNADGADMRHANAFRIPPRGGSDIRCSAAANAECWLQTYIEGVITLLDEGAIAVALINKLLQFIELIFAETGGELLNLVLAVAGAIFDVGGAALTAAFTSDQWDKLLCAIYCNMGDDGQVSADQFVALQAKVTHDLNATAALVVNLLLSTQGEVGVSNAGAIGEETADCSGCDCAFCYTFDFHVDSYTSLGFSAVAPYGTYATGQGWQQASGGLILDFLLDASYLISELDYEGTSFGGIGPFGRAVFWRLGGSTLTTDNQSGIGNPYSIASIENETVNEFWLNPYNGGADLYITKVTIKSAVEIAAFAGHEC